MEERQIASEAVHEEKLNLVLEGPDIGEVDEGPWGLTFKIVTRILVSRRKTLGLANSDQVRYIYQSLFPRGDK